MRALEEPGKQSAHVGEGGLGQGGQFADVLENTGQVALFVRQFDGLGVQCQREELLRDSVMQITSNPLPLFELGLLLRIVEQSGVVDGQGSLIGHGV